MRIDLTVSTVDGVDQDVAVLAPGPVPFAEVAAALRAALGPGAAADGWCSGPRPLTDSDPLGGPGLRTGDRLGTAPRAGEPAVRRLDAVGGVDAGTSLAVARRTIVIGRDAECDVRLRDPDVSRRHAELTFGAAGAVVRDLGSTHGTTIGPDAVTVATIWDPAQWLRVGDTHLALAGSPDGPASLRAARDGTVVVRPHPPSPAVPPPIIELPTVAAPIWSAAANWSAAIVPAVAGVGLAFWTGSATFMVLALLSPLALVATVAADRIRGRRRDRHSREQAAASAARADGEVAQALRHETARRRAEFPDAARVLALARGPAERLWERGTDDLFRVRVGLADLPADARVNRSGRTESAGLLTAVPAVIDLADGPVGLVGPRDTTRAIARWLVAQVAVFASPAVVRIELCADDDAAWSWLRWLPHLPVAASGAGAAPPVVVRVHEALGSTASVTAPAICLAEKRADLPPGCTQVIAVANEAGTRLEVAGREVLTDAVRASWAERLARALAPIVPAPSGDAVLPAECRLRDALGAADPESIARRWSCADGGARAVIGLGADGPVVLDLDRYGPHALIAGTTGAGKSQLLRTLVVALAAAYPPDEIAFVLVDYKGGAAFAECAALPHVAGLVTDLDEHLTARALASLRSELRRRERLFADAQVSDLAGYRAAAAMPPLGRLMIVVDEYATLAEELPDFVAGLTGIAQRGRSLGLHLVLATQRPAGVVTADVRANCSLRIALRVTDAGDSEDVIGGPQAAAIGHDLPGRAYVWTDATARPVQVARTDLPAVARAERVEVRVLGPWRSLAPTDRDGQRSELATLVAAVATAATGRRPVPAPWLPPLPERIPIDALPAPPKPGTAVIGLVDVPSRQTRRPLVLDLRSGCSLLVVGAARTGRTAALVTIAVASARRLEPDELHVHVIDLHGDLGAVLDGLPHRGTLVTPATGFELADALLRELESSGDEACSLLLVDGWDAFARRSAEWDGGDSTERLLSHIRAARHGRTIAISGDRTALTPRLAGAITTRLLLRLPDRADAALAGLPLAAIPRVMPPGRVLLAPDGAEAQLAHAGADPIRTASVAVAQERDGRSVRASPAVRLVPLPTTLDVSGLPAPGEVAPFGVAAPRCRPVGVPLGGPTRLLVAGPARSGRSTALDVLLHQAVRARHPVTVIAPARSPVRAAATRLGVPVVDPHDESAGARLHGAVLVDDSEDLDSPLDDALVRRAREAAPAIVVAARIEDAARAYRGLAVEIRRSRSALLLQPGQLDGEILGIRLRPGMYGGPPGRGVLLADPAWGEACAAGPVRVQVARAGQPICG